MDVDGGLAKAWQGRQQATGMIVMSMTEHDCIGGRQIDPELAGVVDQGHALAGIKKNALFAALNPEGQAVFSQQALSIGRVFDEDGYLCARIRHRSSLSQLTPAGERTSRWPWP